MYCRISIINVNSSFNGALRVEAGQRGTSAMGVGRWGEVVRCDASALPCPGQKAQPILSWGKAGREGLALEGLLGGPGDVARI